MGTKLKQLPLCQEPQKPDFHFLAVLHLTELLVIYIGLKIRISFHEFSLATFPKMQFEATMNQNKLHKTEQITRSVKGIWYVLVNALVWTNPGWRILKSLSSAELFH